MKVRTPILQTLICLATIFGHDLPAYGQNSPQTETNATSGKAPPDPVARRVSEFNDRVQRIRLGEVDRAKEVEARSNNRKNEVQSLRSKLYVALSLPPASGERAEQIDQTYASLRNLVDRLVDDRNQAIIVLEIAKSDHEKATLETENMGSTSDSRLKNSLKQFLNAHQQRVSGVLTEIDFTSAQLVNARTLRRQAKSHTSSGAKASSNVHRLKDIRSEIMGMPIDIESALRRNMKMWWRTPAELEHVQALGGLFLGLTKLALLLVIGMWAHARLPIWVRKLLDRSNAGVENPWDQSSDFPVWVVPGDVRLLAAPLGRFTQDLAVAGVSIIVMVWTGSSAPIIAWLALIFLCGAGVRMMQGIIELGLITPQENRPALMVTDQMARSALSWFIQAFGLLLAIHLILNHLLVSILGADALGSLFREATQSVSILVGLFGLYRWGALFRKRVSVGGSEGSIAAWIVATEKSSIMGVFGAAAALVLLGFRSMVSMAQRLIENRAGLSWVGALLARRQLRDDTNKPREHLPIDIKNAIGHGALRDLIFDSSIAEIRDYFEAWSTDPRRGLIAITGDRGSGKDVLLEQLKGSFDARVVHSTAPLGHTKEVQALNWLIRSTGIDAQPKTESVIKALKQQPKTMFLLSNIHRLFMRAVGHYSGLDSVLDIMQATARHHFWVASFHGPAWSFLAGMNDVGHIGIFPKRINIGPMGPADLSAWLHKRTKTVGYRPSFSNLLQRPSTGAEQTRMIERAERAFWRLMVDVSQGNPTVAARLWVDCLRPGASEGVVEVGVPRAHDSSELENLSDAELFILTAIILHDDISVEELHLVLNQSENRVRSICRGLEQSTLIMETETSRYKVRLNWLPAVERHLRRRSFLHKS